MRETQMFEEIWKEFQREISEEQAFSLSLLMAFSWHYGEWQDDFGLDIGSVPWFRKVLSLRALKEFRDMMCVRHSAGYLKE